MKASVAVHACYFQSRQPNIHFLHLAFATELLRNTVDDAVTDRDPSTPDSVDRGQHHCQPDRSQLVVAFPALMAPANASKWGCTFDHLLRLAQMQLPKALDQLQRLSLLQQEIVTVGGTRYGDDHNDDVADSSACVDTWLDRPWPRAVPCVR